MLCGQLDCRNGRLTLCQAGHPYPIHYRASSGGIDLLGEGGYPIGLFEHLEYSEIEIDLQRGDRIVLCSDGLIEGKTGTIRHIVANTGNGSLRDLVARIADWIRLSTLEDDASMLALEWKG